MRPHVPVLQVAHNLCTYLFIQISKVVAVPRYPNDRSETDPKVRALVFKELLLGEQLFMNGRLGFRVHHKKELKGSELKVPE